MTPKKKKKNTKKDFDKFLKSRIGKKGKGRFPHPIIFLIILAIIIGIFSEVDLSTVRTEIPLNKAIENFNSGIYESVEIRGLDFEGKLSETTPEGNLIIHEVRLPTSDGLIDLGFKILNSKTPIKVVDITGSQFWKDLAPTVIGIVLFVIVLVFIMNKMGGQGGGPMAFIKNRSKLYDQTKRRVKFSDVAGLEEEKEDLMEFVDFLKNPKQYQKLGAKIPRGVLMEGPPGTGKTLIARAVAGESNVPFFSISGSEFVEMFVGVGAARVRDLFKEAKEKAPSIIFIDEIDAIGKKRGVSAGGGDTEREQTLNQILTEMDGFENDTNVIVMAATNRVDVLDRALLRPGRFDRKVAISMPNMEDRKEMLQLYTKGKPMAKGINWDAIASMTSGFSGAEIQNLLNESAILAGRQKKSEISEEMIYASMERIVIGNTKRNEKRTQKEREIVAYHEVGHALVGKMLPHPDPVNKISIIGRGRTGGVTWFLPERDKFLVSKARMQDEIATLYGGRISEEIFFGEEHITTGASNDIERATDIARKMVMVYGFDEELGAENYNIKEYEGGYKISDKTHDLIDKKVRGILENGQIVAREIIEKHKDLHEKITRKILETEEMDRAEFDAFFKEGEAPEKIS